MIREWSEMKWERRLRLLLPQKENLLTIYFLSQFIDKFFAFAAVMNITFKLLKLGINPYNFAAEFIIDSLITFSSTKVQYLKAKNEKR